MYKKLLKQNLHYHSFDYGQTLNTSTDILGPKGQLISEGNFGIFKPLNLFF